MDIDPIRHLRHCRTMKQKHAVAALAALAQEHRLAVFRLLVKEGPSGASAGDVADRVGVPPSTLSHHLAHLERAGLLRSWRVQRNIFYAVDVEGTRRLVAFLTEDCCQGHPWLCGYGKPGPCGDVEPPRPCGDVDSSPPEPKVLGSPSADDPHQRQQSEIPNSRPSGGATALTRPRGHSTS